MRTAVLQAVAGLALAFVPLTAYAQAVTPYFRHLTTEEGLADPHVLALHQDQMGFMWFGTANGLNRYDGASTTTYRALPADSTSLPGNRIYNLYESRDGTLWVGTGGGLARYDREADAFERILTEGSPAISAIHEDVDGFLWLGSFNQRALYRLDPATGSYTEHGPEDDSGELSWVVNAITEDASGVVWVAAGDGLYRVDPATHEPIRHLASESYIGGTHHVLDVWEDPNAVGTFWLFEAQGIGRYEPASGMYEHLFTYPMEFGREGVWWSMPQAAVQDPVEPSVFWLVNPTVGLFRFDTATGQTDRFDTYARAARNLLGSPHSLYLDRTGLLWIGTGNGVSRFDPSIRAFARYSVESGHLRNGNEFVTGVVASDPNTLWVTVGDGLAFPTLTRIDRSSGESRHWFDDHFPDEPDAPDRQNDHEFGWFISTLFADRSGALWIGAEPDGLHRFDPERETFTVYPHVGHEREGLGGEIALSILETHDGTLWVGTDDGLAHFLPGDETFTTTRSDAADVAGLPGAAVQVLYEDRQLDLWVGTDEGLGRRDSDTGQFERFSLSSEAGQGHSVSVTTLHERAREPGVLWVGSLGGLHRLDVQTGTAVHLGDREGVPEFPVAAIVEDEEGYLWVSTRSDGMYRYSPETNAVRWFGTAYGIASTEFWFNAASKSENGEVFFGSREGVYAFFPDRVGGASVPPPVLLTDFKLFGKSVPVEPDSPLPKPLAEMETIVLTHEQNSPGFAFAALHYADPGRNQYSYRLEGFDEDWIDAGTERAASYTNLPPGEYTFRVKAANADGVWNEEGVSVGLRITPPWWRTLWAYLGYGLLLVGGVYAIDRVQRRRLLAQERERARQRELAQAREIEKAHVALQQSHEHLKATQAQLVQQEKLASLGALTAGIAHEIKNPLNFVTNFAEVNDELANELRDDLAAHPEALAAVEDLLADLQQNSRLVVQHGKRADSIVKSMMAHARGGEGERTAVNVNAFVDEYVDLAYHGQRARVPDFNADIVRSYDEAVGAVEMVPQEVGRVLINLLGNAFDAVYEHTAKTKGQNGDASAEYAPRVEVSTRRVGHSVKVRVADNGGGMAEAVKAKIFEPFYTTKPTGQGTGLGLSMSHDIITQGHGGTLEVESAEGEGAAFVVTLPDALPSPAAPPPVASDA